MYLNEVCFDQYVAENISNVNFPFSLFFAETLILIQTKCKCFNNHKENLLYIYLKYQPLVYTVLDASKNTISLFKQN